MLVVLAVFSVVIGVAYTALSLNETYRDLVLTKIQLYRQNKTAMDILCEELQKSAPSRIGIIDNTSPIPDEIQLQVPLVNLIDAAYNIPWGARHGGTDYLGSLIRYRLNGTNFVREVMYVPGTEEIIAENVVDLQFTQSSPTDPYIGIAITSQRMTIRRRTISSTIASTLYLRNQ